LEPIPLIHSISRLLTVAFIAEQHAVGVACPVAQAASRARGGPVPRDRRVKEVEAQHQLSVTMSVCVSVSVCLCVCLCLCLCASFMQEHARARCSSRHFGALSQQASKQAIEQRRAHRGKAGGLADGLAPQHRVPLEPISAGHRCLTAATQASQSSTERQA
jgi:hypothetical protein